MAARGHGGGDLGALPAPGSGGTDRGLSLRGQGVALRQRVAQGRAGSEYINRRVAGLLDKLRVGDFTNSRARRSNDNALVEGKNGSVVRKWLGHGHIPKRFAAEVDAFTQGVLSRFLNFHRPCLFPIEERDDKGRERRRYRDDDVATPYERLRSLPDAGGWLRPGVTFEQLDALAFAQADLEAAKAVNAARDELFRRIGKAWATA